MEESSPAILSRISDETLSLAAPALEMVDGDGKFLFQLGDIVNGRRFGDIRNVVQTEIVGLGEPFLEG